MNYRADKKDMIWDRSVSSQMGILRPWRLRAISAGIHHFTSLVDFIFREATGAGWATALFLGRAWLGPVSFCWCRETTGRPREPLIRPGQPAVVYQLDVLATS